MPDWTQYTEARIIDSEVEDGNMFYEIEISGELAKIVRIKARYSDLRILHRKLRGRAKVPDFPEKGVLKKLVRSPAPDFMSQRQEGLEKYLTAVLQLDDHADTVARFLDGFVHASILESFSGECLNAAERGRLFLDDEDMDDTESVGTCISFPMENNRRMHRGLSVISNWDERLASIDELLKTENADVLPEVPDLEQPLLADSSKPSEPKTIPRKIVKEDQVSMRRLSSLQAIQQESVSHVLREFLRIIWNDFRQTSCCNQCVTLVGLGITAWVYNAFETA